MKKYLQLIRYQNLLMIALMQIIFRYGFLKFQYVFLFLSDFHYFLLILATVLIAAAGYIINDIMDQETDYYNKPDQLIVGKEITEKSAYNLYFALNIMGVLIGFYLANCIQKPSFAGIFILISATLYMYATTLKQMLLVGNIIVSILVSLTILIIGLFDLLPLTFDNNKREMAIIFSLLIDYAIFAFIINFVRELVKDLEDMEGDSNQEMSTLPIVLGLGKTTKVVSVIMILATILLLWYINQNLMTAGLYYAVIYGLVFIVSPLLFVAIKIWNAAKREEFKRYSLLLKWIMFFGIVSISVITLNIKYHG